MVMNGSSNQSCIMRRSSTQQQLILHVYPQVEEPSLRDCRVVTGPNGLFARGRAGLFQTRKYIGSSKASAQKFLCRADRISLAARGGGSPTLMLKPSAPKKWPPSLLAVPGRKRATVAPTSPSMPFTGPTRGLSRPTATLEFLGWLACPPRFTYSTCYEPPFLLDLPRIHQVEQALRASCTEPTAREGSHCTRVRGECHIKHTLRSAPWRG